MLPGLFGIAWATGGGGGGGGMGRGYRKVTAAYNSKTIHDIKIKFGMTVDNHKLIILV